MAVGRNLCDYVKQRTTTTAAGGNVRNDQRPCCNVSVGGVGPARRKRPGSLIVAASTQTEDDNCSGSSAQRWRQTRLQKLERRRSFPLNNDKRWVLDTIEEDQPLSSDVNRIDYPFANCGGATAVMVTASKRKTTASTTSGGQNKYGSHDSPRGCVTVRLTRTPRSTLGIGVAGGADRRLPPVISCLRPGSIAHRCDQIQVGDWLTSVNRVPTLTLTHEQVLTLLRNAGEHIRLQLEYDLNDRYFERPLNTCGKCTDVTLEKEGAGFGFTIRGGSYGPDERKSRPVTITSIRPGGPADREGRLRVGDRILSLNGVDIFSATLQSVLQILDETADAVCLTIEYDVSILETLKKAKGPLQLEIDKPPGVDLGLELTIGRVDGGENAPGRENAQSSTAVAVVVKSIVAASVADRCGALQVEDQVLSIDGIYLEQTTQAEVKRLLCGTNLSVIRLEIIPRCARRQMNNNNNNPNKGRNLRTTQVDNLRRPSTGASFLKKAAKITDSTGQKHNMRAKSQERPYAHTRLEEARVFRSSNDSDDIDKRLMWSRGNRVNLMTSSYHGSAPNISHDKNAVSYRTSGILSDVDSSVPCFNSRGLPSIPAAAHIVGDSGWIRAIGSLSASLSGVPCGQVCHSEVMEVVLNSYTRGGFGLILHKQQPCYTNANNAAASSDATTAANALTVKVPLFISYIERGSPAEKSGVLQVGDRVLAIGDYCTANGTAEEANYIVRHATSPLVLTVEFDVIETVLPSSGVFTVKLAKRGQNLGVVITGSSGSAAQKGEPVVISDIKTGSVAHRCGSILPGDQLQSIDNIPLDACTVEEAVRLLHRSSDIVKLRVKKSGAASLDDTAQTVVYTVELSRRGGPLGITIGYSDDPAGPVFLSQLAAGGLAERTGALHVGDRLLAINGQPLQGRSVAEAMELMKSTGTDTIALKIARSLDAPAPSHNSHYQQSGFFGRRCAPNQRFGDQRGYHYDQFSEHDVSEKLGTPVQSIDSAVESLDDSPSGAGSGGGGDTHHQLASTTTPQHHPHSQQQASGSAHHRTTTAYRPPPKYTDEQLAKCAEELTVQLNRSLASTTPGRHQPKDAHQRFSPIKSAGGLQHTAGTVANGEAASTSSSGHPSSEHGGGGGWDSGMSSAADTHAGERFCGCSCQLDGSSSSAKSQATDDSWVRILEALETVGESEMLKKLEDSIMAGTVPQCDHGGVGCCRPSGSTYPTGVTLANPIPFPITNTILRHPHMHGATNGGGASSLLSRMSNAPDTSTNGTGGSSLSINTHSSAASNHSGVSHDGVTTITTSGQQLQQTTKAKVPPPLPPPKPPLAGRYQGLMSMTGASILSSPSSIVPPEHSTGDGVALALSRLGPSTSTLKHDDADDVDDAASIPFITTPVPSCSGSAVDSSLPPPPPASMLKSPPPALQRLPPRQPLEVVKVTLFKDKEYDDFGFSVSDGEQERGVFVNKIRAGGPADLAGVMRPYDRILQVNSTSLEKHSGGPGGGVAFAVPLLQASGERVSLLFCRDPSAAPPFLPSSTIDEEDETVSIKDSAV